MEPPDLMGIQSEMNKTSSPHSLDRKKSKCTCYVYCSFSVFNVNIILAQISNFKRGSEKQFSYRKLTNENGNSRVKPTRPPPPNAVTNREGVLIDISPDECTLLRSAAAMNEPRNLSLIDEPIDVTQGTYTETVNVNNYLFNLL